MGNMIEEAKSSRATCRTCRQKIDKAALRFGEEMANQFDPGGAPGHVWHHLDCAVKSMPLLVKPALAAYAGEVPNRAAIEAQLATAAAAPGPGAVRAFPYADRAPTSRAKCIACDEPIEKGTMRVAVEREVDTGSFTTRGPGYLHPACAPGHVHDDALMDKIRANSAGLESGDLDAVALELTR